MRSDSKKSKFIFWKTFPENVLIVALYLLCHSLSFSLQSVRTKMQQNLCSSLNEYDWAVGGILVLSFHTISCGLTIFTVLLAIFSCAKQAFKIIQSHSKFFSNHRTVVLWHKEYSLIWPIWESSWIHAVVSTGFPNQSSVCQPGASWGAAVCYTFFNPPPPSSILSSYVILTYSSYIGSISSNILVGIRLPTWPPIVLSSSLSSIMVRGRVASLMRNSTNASSWLR